MHDWILVEGDCPGCCSPPITVPLGCYCLPDGLLLLLLPAGARCSATAMATQKLLHATDYAATTSFSANRYYRAFLTLWMVDDGWTFV